MSSPPLDIIISAVMIVWSIDVKNVMFFILVTFLGFLTFFLFSVRF